MQLRPSSLNFIIPIFPSLKLLLEKAIEHNQIRNERVVWGGGGRKRRSLRPRNDVLTTCKVVTLRGGKWAIGVFPKVNILIEATTESSVP